MQGRHIWVLPMVLLMQTIKASLCPILEQPHVPCPQTKLRNLSIPKKEGEGDAVIMEGLVARDDLATPAASQYSTGAGVNVSQYSE